MRVSELEDERLDYFVIKALGHELEPWKTGWRVRNSGEIWGYVGEITPRPMLFKISPSTDWSQGGPIIEREKIKLEPIHKLKGGEFLEWNAKALPWQYAMEGPTALIAAMRAFVASRFGLEVDDC